MKLFGLFETADITEWYCPLYVQIPHAKLFEKLEEYGPELSVGIEPSDVKKITRIFPMEFESNKIFLDIFNHFKLKGSEIFFLESEKVLEEVARFKQKEIDLRKKLKQGQINEEEKRDLRLKIDRLGIEADYASKIGKEEKILQNLACHKPDLVFLGGAHAARFYQNREELFKKYGVEIEEYWRDTLIKQINEDDLIWAAAKSGKHKSIESYLESRIEIGLEKVEPSDLVSEWPATKHIERLYKAVEERRITNKNPDFIGTDNLDIGYRGLFEVHIENTNHLGNGITEIKGRIEDCLGSAVFSGKIHGNKISFTKKYVEIFDETAPISNEVIYKGVRKGEEYAGTYSYGHLYGLSGEFKMNKFFLGGKGKDL